MITMTYKYARHFCVWICIYQKFDFFNEEVSKSQKSAHNHNNTWVVRINLQSVALLFIISQRIFLTTCVFRL